METSLIKGRLINGWYEFIDKQLYVVFLERVGNRKVLHRVPSDLKPYCYATKDFYTRSRGRIQSYGCQAEFVSDKFVKLSFNLPAQVSLMKKEVGEANFFEADIPFIRRYMIDKRIYGGGKVDKLKRAYMDIECDDSEGMPDPTRHRIIAMSFVDGDGKEFYFADQNEKKMIADFLEAIKDYDLIVGWNLDNFDRPYLEERLKKYGIDWRPEFFQFIDLLFAYRRVKIRKLPSYSLENVSKLELGESKLRDTKTRVIDLSPEELKAYNIDDCKKLYKIDNKMGITHLMELLAEVAGVFINDTNYNSVIVDTIILREARERNIILPSKSARGDDKKKFQGAYMLAPKPGLHKNVICLDFTSLYNRVVQTFNISPDTYLGKDVEATGDYIISPYGTKFTTKAGVIPTVIKKFEDLRDEYKELRNKHEHGSLEFEKYDKLQYIIKTVLLTFYGVIGQKGSRYYEKDIAETVTSCGRYLTQKSIEFIATQKGCETLYADTDSVFVKIADGLDLKEVGYDLCKKLNEEFYPNLLKGFRVENNRIEMKFEKIFEKLIFTGKGEGIKKRYAGHQIGSDKGGKMETVDETVIVGLEYVRGDQCELTKELQMEIIKMLLEEATKEQISEKLGKVRKELFLGALDSKLILSKGLSKPIESYHQKTIPIHVRVAQMIRMSSTTQMLGRVQYMMTAHNPKLSAMPVIDGKFLGKPDYEYYWDVQILPPIERICEGVYGSYHFGVKTLNDFLTKKIPEQPKAQTYKFFQ